jgi:hypothetical protein
MRRDRPPVESLHGAGDQGLSAGVAGAERPPPSAASLPTISSFALAQFRDSNRAKATHTQARNGHLRA